MILYGASGHAKVIIDIIHSIGGDIDAVFDANPQIQKVLGYDVVHSLHDIGNGKTAIVAIGDNNLRQKVVASVTGAFNSVISHPSAVISPYSEIGVGTVVMAQAAINSGAVIGKHCIVNTGAVIEHDVTLEDFVHISPNAAIAGSVKIGEGTHVGIGASVIPGIKIGKWVTVGSGAVIIKDIPDFSTVVGNPGRLLAT